MNAAPDICPHCGFRLPPGTLAAHARVVCPSCRWDIEPGDDPARAAAEEAAAQRRRQSWLVRFCVLLWLLLLLLLFLRRPDGGAGDDARGTVFGDRLALGRQNGTNAGAEPRGHSSPQPTETPVPGVDAPVPAAALADGRGLGLEAPPTPTTNMEPTDAPNAGPVRPGRRQTNNAAPTTNVTLAGPPSAGGDRAVLTDDFNRRLTQAGAQSGDVQISLLWNNFNDLDLHCVDPRGEEIFYNHRSSRTGGVLDVDRNVRPETTRPVENIYWARSKAPRGTYIVYVNHYRAHGAGDPTPYSVRVLVKGQLKLFQGTISHGENKREVCRVTVDGG